MKLKAKPGATLSAIARLSGSENHKGFDILHADGYAVAYVIPIDEDGVEGGKLARQFAAAPELLEALEKAERALQGIATAQRFDRDVFSDDSAYVDWARSLSLHVAEIARTALAKARGKGDAVEANR